jgi:hypothetical protein
MNIFLTFDYEIFFGEVSGSVDKCMIEPSEALLSLAEKHGIQYTFFWDIGHYLALERFAQEFPELEIDKNKIANQLTQVLKLGHDIQLHIHPHWEKASFENGKWNMNLRDHYKLSDFPEKERKAIFAKYNDALTQFKGEKSKAFRAGGWCIQPFSDFETLFKVNGIRIDSSTMPGVKWISKQYQLDFTKLVASEPFRFSSDECQEDVNGEFLEYPITSKYYSPIFFWRLYILGRLFPSQHKMWGDGNFVSQPGGKKESLTKGKIHHASSDGFFASELEAILKTKRQKAETTMVVIGHPKSLTKFSLKKLENFVKKNKSNNQFSTFQDIQ